MAHLAENGAQDAKAAKKSTKTPAFGTKRATGSSGIACHHVTVVRFVDRI